MGSGASVGDEPTIADKMDLNSRGVRNDSSSRSDDREVPIDAKINPALRPIKLIIFAAKIAKIAIPIIDKAMGNVAKNFTGLN